MLSSDIWVNNISGNDIARTKFDLLSIRRVKQTWNSKQAWNLDQNIDISFQENVLQYIVYFVKGAHFSITLSQYGQVIPPI